MFRFLVALLVCGTFLVTAPTGRAAGATVIDEDYACDTYLDFTTCSSTRLVWHVVSQPDFDGDQTAHSDERLDIYGPTGLLLSLSISQDYHYVTVEHLLQEMHDRSKNTFGVAGSSCTSESRYHYANGRIQRQQYDFYCDPPL